MRYELRREGPNTLLFPPKAGSNSEATASQIKISHARSHTPPGINCDIRGGLVSLHWQGKTAELTLQPESYFAELPSQASMPAKRSLRVDPLRGLEAFQNALLATQENGCLASDENRRLRRRLVESVPLAPEVAYFLELGSYDVTGFFDLTSDFRLEIISPIYPEGAARDPEHLKGYETAYYNFEGAPGSDRIRLSFAAAKQVLVGGAPVEKHSSQVSAALPNFSGYYRLLFMREEMPANSVRRAILLAAPEESELTKATPEGQSDAEGFCKNLKTAKVSCVAFPANFGVNPQLRVRVNEKYDFVSVGGMLFEVLGIDPKADPPKTLKVRRVYRGRLIPIQFTDKADVLRLVLLPGDEVTY